MATRNTKHEITSKNENDEKLTISGTASATCSKDNGGKSKDGSSQSDISTRSKTRRFHSASHKRYKEKRTASRIIQRIEPIPPAERNERQQASLEWAKSVVEQGESGANSTTAIKRPDYIISEEEEDDDGYEAFDASMFDANQAKRQKLQNSPFTNIILGIVDRSVSDGSITVFKWIKVEAALLKLYFDIMKEYPGEPPSCRDVGWYEDRVKLISCSDDRSVDLLKIALSRLLGLWPDMRLDAIPINQIPMKPTAFGEIPAEPFESTTILNLLKLSNPQLKVENWKIINLSEPPIDNRRAIVISVDNEAIEHLVEAKGVLNYGFSSIKLQVSISKGFGVLERYGDVVIEKELTEATSFSSTNNQTDIAN